jgi:hypothetical protein
VFFGDRLGGASWEGWIGAEGFGNPPPEVDARGLSPDPSLTDARFVSADGSEFQLDALDFDNFSSPSQTFDAVILGYRDGSQVASKTETLSQTGGGNWVTVTFGSDFENIDEVRVATNGYSASNPSGLAMDNVVVDDAVTNTTPTFTAGASTSLTVDEDAPATSISSPLEVDDPDSGQTLEWTVSSGPSNGTLAGFPATESSGGAVQPSGVTYEPNTDYAGTDAFDVQVADGNGGSATITVNVTVNNLAPVFNSPSTASFAENGTGTALDINADNGGDGSDDSGVDYSITGGTDSGAFGINTSTGELSFDSVPDFENPADSDGQNDYVVEVTANDGASNDNTTTQTITISVTDVNEAPSISDLSNQTIQEDGTLSSLAFTVDDPETNDLSTLSLSGSSDNTTLVPNSNISFTGPDASGDASVTVQPASNESGTATIKVTADDGSATGSESFTLTVEAVVDLAITGGASSGLDFTASASAGTDDNAVGLFQLTGGQSGATLTGLTITSNAPGVEGITAAALYLSSDQSLDPGTDTELQQISVDPTSAPETYSFTGLSESVPTSDGYLFFAIDLESGAPANDVRFLLEQPADLAVTDGEVATVNGQSQTSFSSLFLSNNAATLPVELTRFAARRAGGDGDDPTVALTWKTASETKNAGFRVERRTAGGDAGGAWRQVGYVESKALGGTSSEALSYRYRDGGVPFAADTVRYRLTQVDTDGTTSRSDVVEVALGAVEELQLQTPYPNPARGAVTVKLAVPQAKSSRATLRLYNALGQAVRAVDVGEGRQQTRLQTGELASGVYFLRLTAGGDQVTRKLTVVR